MPLNPQETPMDAESYEALVAAARESTAALGAWVKEAERLGIAPMGAHEMKEEVKGAGDALAKQLGALMQVIEATSSSGQVDEDSLRLISGSLQELAVRFRRLLAPTNSHRLATTNLYALPMMFEHLPPLLLAVSKLGGLDPDLSGRLFILSGEYEFFEVLLSLATERDEKVEVEGESAAAAVDRLRGELDAVATSDGTTDVALLRKRLNDALDELESEGDVVEDILSRIAETSDLIEAQRANLDHLVATAREQGASWNKIARAVGISAQSAHKRWDPEARAKARKYMQEYSARRHD